MKVEFTESTHIYTDTETSENYISVTTIIGKYTPPFQTEYWSTYKAIKQVLSKVGTWQKYKRKAGGWQNVVDYFNVVPTSHVSEILKVKQQFITLWEKKSKEACELGTARHKEKEIEVLGIENCTYAQTDGELVEHGAYTGDIDAFTNVENGIFAELLIYDCEFKIAGQVDYVRKTGKDIWISDYKTSKIISNEPFMDNKMLFPLDTLYDTNFNHYALQLSLYGYLLERKGFNVKGLDIIHIDRNTGESKQTIELPYLRELVIKMLIDYKNCN